MYGNTGNKWFEMQAELVYELFMEQEPCQDFLERPIVESMRLIEQKRDMYPDHVPHCNAELTALCLYHARKLCENE